MMIMTMIVMIMMTLMQVDLYTTEQRVSSAPVTINAHKNELVCLAVSQQGGMVRIFVATRGNGTYFCYNKGAWDVFVTSRRTSEFFCHKKEGFVTTRRDDECFCARPTCSRWRLQAQREP